MLNSPLNSKYRLLLYCTLAVFVLAGFLSLRAHVQAQQPEDQAGPSAGGASEVQSNEAPVEESIEDDALAEETSADAPASSKEDAINALSLIARGGVWMIPIFIMSLLTLTFVIERSISLRRERVIPSPLVHSLGRIGGDQGKFDPRQAYRLCQQYPSATANVIRAMLLKVGRPHSEVEHAVMEASDREANRLYANVRWLNLSAAVSPLLGLLGTVWGMIQAFHAVTLLGPGENRADALAKGIYEALVTTLGGLCVAIPAAFFAHLLEGRIQTLFRQIDELLFNLMPQIERYEGRLRFSRQMGESEHPSPPAAANTASSSAGANNGPPPPPPPARRAGVDVGKSN